MNKFSSFEAKTLDIKKIDSQVWMQSMLWAIQTTKCNFGNSSSQILPTIELWIKLHKIIEIKYRSALKVCNFRKDDETQKTYIINGGEGSQKRCLSNGENLKKFIPGVSGFSKNKFRRDKLRLKMEYNNISSQFYSNKLERIMNNKNRTQLTSMNLTDQFATFAKSTIADSSKLLFYLY